MQRFLACLPLFLAAASAFVPLHLAPLRSGTPGVSSALRRSRAPAAHSLQRRACSCRSRFSTLCMAAAGASEGNDSMQELLEAAAATREQLQSSSSQEANVLALAGAVGDKTGADGLGLKELRAVIEADYAAVIEDVVYAAPEPPFKMLPKSADRVAQRVLSFAASPPAAATLQEVAASGVGLADFSHGGVIAVTGADRFRFVNGLCTNKVLDAKPGQVLASCFTNKLGRSVDLTTVAVLQDSILILCSPNRLQHLYEAMDALIFPKDDVELEDLSLALARFQLVGPQAASLLSATPDGASVSLPSSPAVAAWGDSGLVLSGSGLATPGFTVLVPVKQAVPAWRHLAAGIEKVRDSRLRGCRREGWGGEE